jgi:hypothetical protein
MFRIGQKVVCINARGFETYLTLRSIYTITSICGDFLRVDCAPSPIMGPASCGYYFSRFRPLVERKTSIEVFRKMLHPSSEEILNHIMSDTLADIYSAEQ